MGSYWRHRNNHAFSFYADSIFFLHARTLLTTTKRSFNFLFYWCWQVSLFAPAMQSIELVEESSPFILKISLILFRYSFHCFLNSSLLNSRQRRDKGCRHFSEPCDDWIIQWWVKKTKLCFFKTDLHVTLEALRWNDLDSPKISYWPWIVSIYIIQFVTHFNKEFRQKKNSHILSGKK